MNLESDLEYYVENPDRLLDLCREVLERLDTGAGCEAAKQLQAVSAAIADLERQSVPVPAALRGEKLRLADEQANYEATAGKLRNFVDGLAELVRHARPSLASSNPIPMRKKRASRLGPITPRETIRQLILDVLVCYGGRASTAKLCEAIEERMQGLFLPGDLEITVQGGHGQIGPAWRGRVRQEHKLMAREGILRDDSPRGLWELN